MARVTRSSEIEAGPEYIWQFIEDPQKELTWRQPEVTDLEIVGDEPVSVGTRYRGRTEMMGVTDEYTNEIIEYDPPHRISWRAISSTGMVAGSGYYQLRPIGGGKTRFEISLEYKPQSMLGRLVEPLVPLLAGPVLQRFAQKLKNVSEAE